MAEASPALNTLLGNGATYAALAAKAANIVSTLQGENSGVGDIKASDLLGVASGTSTIISNLFDKVPFPATKAIAVGFKATSVVLNIAALAVGDKSLADYGIAKPVPISFGSVTQYVDLYRNNDSTILMVVTKDEKTGLLTYNQYRDDQLAGTVKETSDGRFIYTTAGGESTSPLNYNVFSRSSLQQQFGTPQSVTGSFKPVNYVFDDANDGQPEATVIAAESLSQVGVLDSATQAFSNLAGANLVLIDNNLTEALVGKDLVDAYAVYDKNGIFSVVLSNGDTISINDKGAISSLSTQILPDRSVTTLVGFSNATTVTKVANDGSFEVISKDSEQNLIQREVYTPGIIQKFEIFNKNNQIERSEILQIFDDGSSLSTVTFSSGRTEILTKDSSGVSTTIRTRQTDDDGNILEITTNANGSGTSRSLDPDGQVINQYTFQRTNATGIGAIDGENGVISGNVNGQATVFAADFGYVADEGITVSIRSIQSIGGQSVSATTNALDPMDLEAYGFTWQNITSGSLPSTASALLSGLDPSALSASGWPSPTS